MSSWQTLGLPCPHPSSPSKWGKYCLWISHPDRFLILTYAEAYYPKRMIDELISDKTWDWAKNKTEIFVEGGWVIKSDYLKELMDYKYKKNEEDCDLEKQDQQRIDRILYGKAIPQPPISEKAKDHASKEYDKEVKRAEKKKHVERPTGLIALQDICEELKIDPRDARAILRKKKIDKPEHGRWEWSKDEVDKIKRILK